MGIFLYTKKKRFNKTLRAYKNVFLMCRKIIHFLWPLKFTLFSDFKIKHFQAPLKVLWALGTVPSAQWLDDLDGNTE